MMRGIEVVSYGILSLALACSSASSSPPSGSSPVAPRGTTACHAWQTAVCAWESKCAAPNLSVCAEQTTAIACTSDTQAQSCADALNTASCEAPPSGCDLRDVADRAPAAVACQKFVDTVCSSVMRCDAAATADSCQAQVQGTTDCTSTIGVKLSFEQCIADMQASACPIRALPAICNGVLLKTL